MSMSSSNVLVNARTGLEIWKEAMSGERLEKIGVRGRGTVFRWQYLTFQTVDLVL